MIPTKQTVLHDPEKREDWGTAFLVLASLLHMPIEDVPVFLCSVAYLAERTEFMA